MNQRKLQSVVLGRDDRLQADENHQLNQENIRLPMLIYVLADGRK
jgi:hypothetical protein